MDNQESEQYKAWATCNRCTAQMLALRCRTHSKQGRAHGQRARAANKGRGVAHRLVADAWLAEEQYAHVAEDGHEQLGPVFEQRRGHACVLSSVAELGASIRYYGPHESTSSGCVPSFDNVSGAGDAVPLSPRESEAAPWVSLASVANDSFDHHCREFFDLAGMNYIWQYVCVRLRQGRWELGELAT